MKTNELQMKDELPVVLNILAEFYKYPNEDFYNEVASGNLDKELTSLFSKLDVQIDLKFQAICPPLKELQSQFMDLFSGIKQPCAAPVESLYKQWTTDPTAQVSIAKSKGYLMGDAALHMKYLYEQFQIEVPEGYQNMPDHLTLQLEFLAYLHECSNFETGKQFTDEHLDWLGTFLEELEKLEDNAFYLNATLVLQTFLKNYYMEI